MASNPQASHPQGMVILSNDSGQLLQISLHLSICLGKRSCIESINQSVF